MEISPFTYFRKIKPDNILLDKDNEDTIFPVISDFGIVKIMKHAGLVAPLKALDALMAKKQFETNSNLSLPFKTIISPQNISLRIYYKNKLPK